MGGNGAFVRLPNGEWLLTKKAFSTVDTVEGVKVVRMDGYAIGKLPQYSNTSEAYICVSQNGELTQLRVFADHYPVKDIDLSHAYHHKVGEIHVHDYDLRDPRHPRRSKKGRPLSKEEERLYAEIIKAMKGYMK